MEARAIFGPVFATMTLTFVVWVYMYIRRLTYMSREKISSTAPDASKRINAAPPAVTNPSDNLKNLFEVPPLFYALCFALFLTEQVDATFVTAGWVFAGFRALHSLVHSTFNLIPLRFAVYVISAGAAWFMVVRGALGYFT